MRLLLLMVLVGGGIWALQHYTDADMRHQVLAKVGLDRFWEETAPRYLREKFSVPASPLRERSRLIGDLEGRIDTINKSIAALDPTDSSGKSTALPSTSVIRSEVAAIREAAAASEALVQQLHDVNASEGVVQKTTARLLDAVLPVATSSVCVPL